MPGRRGGCLNVVVIVALIAIGASIKGSVGGPAGTVALVGVPLLGLGLLLAARDAQDRRAQGPEMDQLFDGRPQVVYTPRRVNLSLDLLIEAANERGYRFVSQSSSSRRHPREVVFERYD